MIATAATGTLTRKIEPQEKCSSSQPPVIGPDGDADAHHGSPQPDRPAARRRVGEDVGDQPQCGREDHRGADAHRGARRDQRIGRVHLRGNGGGDREDSEPGAEPATSAVAVAQAARRQQQAGHDEGVGVDDPLQVRGVGVEFARQRGQCDVDDGGVDTDDEDAQADDGKRGDRMIAEYREAKIGTHRHEDKPR